MDACKDCAALMRGPLKPLTRYPEAWVAMYCFALALTVPSMLMAGGRWWYALPIAAFATGTGALVIELISENRN